MFQMVSGGLERVRNLLKLMKAETPSILLETIPSEITRNPQATLWKIHKTPWNAFATNPPETPCNALEIQHVFLNPSEKILSAHENLLRIPYHFKYVSETP